MNQIKYYHYKAKIFLQKKFKSIFLLYTECYGIYSLIYIAMLSCCEFFIPDIDLNITLVVARSISMTLSFCISFKLIERFKNKYKHITDVPLLQIIFIGIIYGACELSDLIYLPGTLTVISSFIKIIGQIIFTMFLMYTILSKNVSFGNMFKYSTKLFTDKSKDFLITILSFIPLWLCGQIIIQIPSQSLINLQFVAALPVFHQLSIIQASTFIFALIGIIPVYADAKLYTGLWIMFEDNI